MRAGFRPLNVHCRLNALPAKPTPLPDRSERLTAESAHESAHKAFTSIPFPIAPERMTTRPPAGRLRLAPYIRSSNRRGALQILSAVGPYLLLWALAIQAAGTPSGRFVIFGSAGSLLPPALLFH